MAFFVGPYLKLRSGTWYFRRRVPQTAIVRLGRREILLSLHTDSQRIARRKALACLDVIDRLLESDDTLTAQAATTAIEALRATMRGAQFQLATTVGIEQSQPLPLKRQPTSWQAAANAPSKTILEAWEEYELEHRSQWRERTVSQYRQAIDEFTMTDFCGNKDVVNVRREDLVEYREKLAKLPAQRTKSREFRALTIAELLEIDIPESKRLSDRTINERLTLLSSFFRWCKEVKHYIDDDVTFRIQITNVESEERAAFTEEDLSRLFGTEIYTQRKYDHVYQYWIPILGYYTGARISELAQLHCVDLVTVDGIQCLRIKDDGDSQRIKTKNSSRLVPLHPELAQL